MSPNEIATWSVLIIAGVALFWPAGRVRALLPKPASVSAPSPAAETPPAHKLLDAFEECVRLGRALHVEEALKAAGAADAKARILRAFSLGEEAKKQAGPSGPAG
jgi:hypothetical protein